MNVKTSISKFYIKCRRITVFIYIYPNRDIKGLGNPLRGHFMRAKACKLRYMFVKRAQNKRSGCKNISFPPRRHISEHMYFAQTFFFALVKNRGFIMKRFKAEPNLRMKNTCYKMIQLLKAYLRSFDGIQSF